MTYENPFEIVENYDNDIKNGFFIQKWNESKICKGYYLNNKMNYWGIFDSDEINIKGYFSDNILDGYGETYNKEDKITYKGYWEKGLLEGIGQEFNELFLYEGYFINSKRNGFGVQIYKNEDEKYEGEWKVDKYEGFGIYYFSNGNKYIGQWKNSAKEGFGQLIWANNIKKYMGFFKNDEKNGLGIYLYKKDCISICFWEEGKKQGLEKCIINKEKLVYKRWENNKLIEVINENDFFEILKDEISGNYINIFNMDFNNIILFMDV